MPLATLVHDNTDLVASVADRCVAFVWIMIPRRVKPKNPVAHSGNSGTSSCIFRDRNRAARVRRDG